MTTKQKKTKTVQDHMNDLEDVALGGAAATMITGLGAGMAGGLGRLAA